MSEMVETHIQNNIDKRENSLDIVKFKMNPGAPDFISQWTLLSGLLCFGLVTLCAVYDDKA